MPRTARARAYIWLPIVVLLFVAGCAAPSGPAVDSVNKYLQGLPTALHADTLSQIAPYSTEDQLDRIRRYVAYELNRGERMQAVLEDHVVLKESIANGSATVDTQEDWAFDYLDAKSGDVRRQEHYRIHARYYLLQENGAWHVNDIEEIRRITL